MLTRLLSRYLQAYFRSCELANRGPHEAHTCVLLGPQGFKKKKTEELRLVANV